MVLIKVVILNNYLVYLKTTNSFLYKRKRNERCEICGINKDFGETFHSLFLNINENNMKFKSINKIIVYNMIYTLIHLFFYFYKKNIIINIF